MSGSTTAVTASAATTAITLYYTNILQRTPDAAGLAGWVAAVTSGALTLAQVESNFIASPEAINYVDPIITLYTSLGRVPDAAGLAGFVAQLKAGTSLASITNVFLTSVEGQGIYGASPTTSPTAFVATLYQEILGRAPETAGAAYWAGQLTSGAMTAAQVLNAIAASAEATARDATPITNFLTSAGLGTATYTGPLVTTVAAATAVPLTTGLDNLVGGTGNNTFNAIDGGVNGTTPTWTIGDTLVGGSGVNTFNDTSSTAITAVPTSATLSGIQTANFLDAAAVSLITTSGFTGLTALNITDVGSASASVTAAGTTSVSVTTSAEGIFSDTILGGLNDALTVAGVTTGGAIAVGSLTALPLGTITVSVTDANTGTATGSSIATTGGTIVTVTENITAATSTTGNPGVANTDTGGAITVIGGSATTSVTVAQTAPVTAVAGITAVAAATATDTVTWQAFSEAGTQVIGGVTVTSTGGNFSAVQVALVANGGSVSGLSVSGSGTTWSVAQTLVGTGGTSLFTSVVASAPVAIGAGVPSTTANIAPTAVQTAVPTTGGAHGVDTVTWQAFTGAGTQTIGGVTVTSTGAFTATQVATSVATGNNAGVAVPGLTISGIGTTWTVAALGATTSQFTDVTATTGDTLAGSGGQTTTFATAAPTAVAGIIGVAAVAGVTAVGGIADGIVTITDINGTSTTAAGTITTASLNGYAAGSTIVDGALTSLTLAGTGFGLTVSNSLATQTATTLALTLNGLTDTTGFTDATIKTLNVVTGGTSASTLAALTATALTSLNVSGTQTLAISSATPSTSLTAITVSGGAGLSVALAPTTTFTSTSTGTDLVTITAATTQVVTGNGTAAEEIIWNGTSSPAATAYLGSVTGFKVLGIGGLVTGTESFDMSKITGFTGFDVQANGNAYTVNLTKVTAGSPLAIDGTIG
jgi:S-layer protein